uniref:YGGT family protein n=1 Tax=Arundo donax TaxID=35708 RepID=A0A0A9GL15_ARUDO
MEASLLVAPKPSMSRAVSVFFSVRGHSRRCLVAAAASHGKELDPGVQQVLPSKALRARGGLFAVAAAAVSGAVLTLPCHASALEMEPSRDLFLYRALAVLGDLDPATAKTVAGVAGPALSAFGFLFILRIVMSWYPRLPVTEFPYVLAYAPTEPFLAVTRKVIPPLGGVDVTPVVWFGLVSFLNEILVGPQGLLVLLSQQV